MSNIKKFIIMAVVGLALGFVAVKQFYLNKAISRVSEPEQGNLLAVEVAGLIKNNGRLRTEVESLVEEHTKLSQTREDTKSATDTLEQNLAQYKIILGLAKTEGKGIVIDFNDKIDSSQLVDLVNALKNMGVEAICINHKRLSTHSSIETGLFYPPTKVEAIGNPDILEEALTRKGGIIEQIGSGQVKPEERLILPSI